MDLIIYRVDKNTSVFNNDYLKMILLNLPVQNISMMLINIIFD